MINYPTHSFTGAPPTTTGSVVALFEPAVTTRSFVRVVDDVHHVKIVIVDGTTFGRW